MRFHIDQTTGSRSGRMIRRDCLSSDPEKTVGPANRLSAMRCSVRINALEITHQKRAKVNSRRQTRTAYLRVKRFTRRFGERHRIPAFSTTGSDARRNGGRRVCQGEPLRSRSAPASHVARACPMTCFHRKANALLKPGQESSCVVVEVSLDYRCKSQTRIRTILST